MPRNAALYILNELDKRRYTLDRLIEDTVDKEKFFSNNDRALFNIIIYGVLRRRKRLDSIIEYFSNIPFERIDDQVLNILRIGIFQIRYLDRIPAFAAVNTSVQLAKKSGNRWSANFVNGVLRNIVRNPDLPKLPEKDDNILKYISTAESFPEWLVKRWIESLGTDNTERLCEALNMTPDISIRVNTLKIDRESFMNELSPFVDNISATEISPYGITFRKSSTRIDKLPGYEKGLFQVQDEAAQIASILLAPKPGEKILDAFAGLGGKTGHIGELMNNRGKITAADYDKNKLMKLDESMKRLGITNVESKYIDFGKNTAYSTIGKFDKILIDAPCSGLGVIRRNPDTKWMVFPKDLRNSGLRQIRLLDNLSCYLKDSGIMLYTVCSTEPEETEDVLNVFLNNHPEFRIRAPRADKDLLSKISFGNNYFKTFTHVHNTDGFFYSCLEKTT